MPADDEILDAARAGVVDLNARLGQGRTDRFHLFHRARQWNPGEGSWIGWERKRGKLEEFNRLLRGAKDTSFRVRSEEHTSELQSLAYLVCRLLLEKKKNTK